MDVTDDRIHATLYRMVKEAGAPDYVMDSPVMGEKDAERLPDSLFADPFRRKFPIGSKADTWTSAAYFAKTASSEYGDDVLASSVRDRLLKAADMYGIRKDVDSVMSRMSAVRSEKRAGDDMSSYGWPEERRYPMFDEEGVRLANGYFQENAYKYPSDTRREIASRIFSKSAEYGIEPSDAVRVESGNGFQTREHAAYQILDRARVLSAHDRGAMAVMSKLAEAVAGAPCGRYGEIAEKAAEILSRIDEETGLDKGYGRRFESPMRVFFGRSVKEAEDMLEDTVDLDGIKFSANRLARLPMSVFTDALGDGFAQKVASDNGDDNDDKDEKDGKKDGGEKNESAGGPGNMRCVVIRSSGSDMPEIGGMGSMVGGMLGGIDPLKLARELGCLSVPSKRAVVRSITYYVG